MIYFVSLGLVPTLVQIFPHAGLQFGFYSFFKALWEMSFRIKVHGYCHHSLDVLGLVTMLIQGKWNLLRCCGEGYNKYNSVFFFFCKALKPICKA